MVLLVCFLWIVLSWTIFKFPTYFQGVGWERREKSLSSTCQLTPCFSLMPCPCTWLGLVSSTFRDSVALLICKIVPLLPAVRRTRPFKHNFSLPLSTIIPLDPLRRWVGQINTFLIRMPSVDLWSVISSTLLNHLQLLYHLYCPKICWNIILVLMSVYI